MTNNTGKAKKHRKKYQFLNKKGARNRRMEFIENSYVKGVFDEGGNRVIRPLNDEEINFLDNFYKEYVHSAFITDKESTKLFKKVKELLRKPENVKFYKENGFHPVEVEEAVERFNVKTKKLGNFSDFWQQKDINSDDYKRRYDIQNNCVKGLQVYSFEDIFEGAYELEDLDSTRIEDLITESEK
jgi:hypothetical protein